MKIGSRKENECDKRMRSSLEVDMKKSGTATLKGGFEHKKRRPYVKPAIAEEESYKTCAILTCTKSSPVLPPTGCGPEGYKFSG
jgi:hypothetical protein